MSGISKRVSGSWVSGDYGIMKTATDTITTLPADIYVNDTTATVGLKGNMEQNGTPTPDNPIMPEGTGERTGNLMPAGELKTVEVNGITFVSDGKGKYSIRGTATAYASVRFNLLQAFTTPISVSNGGQGTLSFFNTQSNTNVNFVFCNGTTHVDTWRQTPIGRVSTEYKTVGNKYVDNIVITVNSGTSVDMTITPEFTNDGVLPSEFEPNGYKIPILSNSTTTPVYLGEVESTRKIGKLVLTGQETNWIINSNAEMTNTIYVYMETVFRGDALNLSLCSHFIYKNVFLTDEQAFHFVANQYGSLRFRVDKTIAVDLTAWKAYLAQQYSNGTPVTIWYQLAEPTTGIVNEPIRKIGTYADEISDITIPTIAGANAVDVLTTLKPSEVTANYHGWHTGAVHERDSGAWD